MFSYYSATDYFLDSITYHGHPEELHDLLSGYTRVLIHESGTPISSGNVIPPMRIDAGAAVTDDGTGSHIGDTAGLLQAAPLDIGACCFALQLYGGDFPPPFCDVFGLRTVAGMVKA